ncbi:hypothetical protein SteCoe_20576 [Stentor coeruleus]|uniref:Uncharacterized protein n=1 Tax=Stentor coeruleus TaxID=5963 RepID=A0A1R2BRU8_9CILI|nr:hypothetical protein SteCoe_20576 [Stentor coeruleus]
MNWQNEVTNWIKVLQKEADGLSNLLAQISSSNTKSSNISRLLNAISILKEGVLNLIDKCTSMLKFSTEPTTKLENLRNEYTKAMNNLKNLFNTISQSKIKTNNNYSTFASRNRSMSKQDMKTKTPINKTSDRNKSATPKKRVEFIDQQTGYNGEIKSKLIKLKEEIEGHVHREYKKKISELEAENFEIRKKIEAAKEESKENMRSLEELRVRMSEVERRKSTRNIYSPSDTSIVKKQRFLIKSPSQTAEGFTPSLDYY